MNHRHNPSAREVAVLVMNEIDTQGAYSNLALKAALSRAHLQPVDSALVTEIVYGTVQWLRMIDERVQPFLKQPLIKLDPVIRNILRTAVYQIEYLDRIPAFAAVNEAVNLAKRHVPKASALVNAVLRNIIRSNKPSRDVNHSDSPKEIALYTSHPDWMVERWISQFGKQATVALCCANNERPYTALRVQSMRTTRDELMTELERVGVRSVASELSNYGVRLLQGTDIAKLDAFQNGLCTVQDESSMLVAPVLDPQPGMRVLDACAAPGGKTTHLAELMSDEGEIIASDIHEHKVELIRTAAQRLGLRSIRPLSGDILELLPELGTFDAILLDAPCTGLGVIRRKPDVKWRKSLQDIQDITPLQRKLLEQTWASLRSGGILVYSTCTMELEENEWMIESFLAAHPDAIAEDVAPFIGQAAARLSGDKPWVQLLPHQTDSDGFFIARLRKM